jgi:hypothetical protein
MAITKAKRSVHLAQPSTKILRRRPRPTRRTTSSKLMFPEAKGRVIEFIEFFADSSSNSNSIHLRFQDNTSLSFQFATGLVMEAYSSRWKAGNERVLRYWPRVYCQPIF